MCYRGRIHAAQSRARTRQRSFYRASTRAIGSIEKLSDALQDKAREDQPEADALLSLAAPVAIDLRPLRGRLRPAR
jgi:hypothetical protein